MARIIQSNMTTSQASSRKLWAYVANDNVALRPTRRFVQRAAFANFGSYRTLVVWNRAVRFTITGNGRSELFADETRFLRHHAFTKSG